MRSVHCRGSVCVRKQVQLYSPKIDAHWEKLGKWSDRLVIYFTKRLRKKQIKAGLAVVRRKIRMCWAKMVTRECHSTYIMIILHSIFYCILLKPYYNYQILHKHHCTILLFDLIKLFYILFHFILRRTVR